MSATRNRTRVKEITVISRSVKPQDVGNDCHNSHFILRDSQLLTQTLRFALKQSSRF